MLVRFFTYVLIIVLLHIIIIVVFFFFSLALTTLILRSNNFKLLKDLYGKFVVSIFVVHVVITLL